MRERESTREDSGRGCCTASSDAHRLGCARKLSGVDRATTERAKRKKASESKREKEREAERERGREREQ